MWFIYALAVSVVAFLASRKWGRHFYQRWSRHLFFRRIVGKSRPPTPPLEERLNEHSIFEVYDDGSIVSNIKNNTNKIDKPMVMKALIIIYYHCKKMFKKFFKTLLRKFTIVITLYISFKDVTLR